MSLSLFARQKLFYPLAESGFAALIGLGVGGILLIALGYNVPLTFYYLLVAPFGSVPNISTTLSNTAPLILTAMTFAVGVRTGLFNIGAEGQVYVGAAAVIVVSLISLPPGIHLLLAIAVAGLAGAAWSLPVFLLKAARGVNEVISTIMLNGIALNLMFFVSINYLVEPSRTEKTISVLPSSRFPILNADTGLSAAIIFAIIVALAFYAYFWLTSSGYELRAVGLNLEAARFGGVNPKKAYFFAFALGGLASGFAGAVQVAGRSVPYALFVNLSNVTGYGFDGIGVALIGRNHPIALIFAAIFIGALQSGLGGVQLYAKVPFEIIEVIQGVIVIALAAPEALRTIRRKTRR